MAALFPLWTNTATHVVLGAIAALVAGALRVVWLHDAAAGRGAAAPGGAP